MSMSLPLQCFEDNESAFQNRFYFCNRIWLKGTMEGKLEEISAAFRLNEYVVKYTAFHFAGNDNDN